MIEFNEKGERINYVPDIEPGMTNSTSPLALFIINLIEGLIDKYEKLKAKFEKKKV